MDGLRMEGGELCVAFSGAWWAYPASHAPSPATVDQWAIHYLCHRFHLLLTLIVRVSQEATPAHSVSITPFLSLPPLNALCFTWSFLLTIGQYSAQRSALWYQQKSNFIFACKRIRPSLLVSSSLSALRYLSASFCVFSSLYLLFDDFKLGCHFPISIPLLFEYFHLLRFKQCHHFICVLYCHVINIFPLHFIQCF